MKTTTTTENRDGCEIRTISRTSGIEIEVIDGNGHVTAKRCTEENREEFITKKVTEWINR